MALASDWAKLEDGHLSLKNRGSLDWWDSASVRQAHATFARFNTRCSVAHPTANETLVWFRESTVGPTSTNSSASCLAAAQCVGLPGLRGRVDFGPDRFERAANGAATGI